MRIKRSSWCRDVGFGRFQRRLILLCTLSTGYSQSWGPPPATTKNEISFSADYLHGFGHVAVPFGFGLSQSLPIAPTVKPSDRDSDYVGATLSYSFGQEWYLDLSYAHGESHGSADLGATIGAVTNPEFEIDDNWYQAYARYAFPGLLGKRYFAYLRAGVTYVEANLRNVLNEGGVRYELNDPTDDILGNLGFGVGYYLFASSRMKLGLQLEGEGFFGVRYQDVDESLSTLGVQPASVSLDNWTYGGIGRLTGRFEYGFGRTGTFKFFVDGGMQARYSAVDYDSFRSTTFRGGNFDELLWGPYAKLGLSYAF